MDTLPGEVLCLICAHLEFEDAANLRLLTRNLSNIAAESLVTRVCFHTSQSSLQRLELIAKHPAFSRNVKTLVYEAALLADVRCRHEYARHFELDHHGLERPREPPPTCSQRERRLYLRNKAKWTQSIYTKYDVYRSLYDSQRSLLENNAVNEVLSRCISMFPKLETIDVDPIRRCSHMTSKRFIEEFGTDCASPLSGNFSHISNQFQSVFLPNNSIITSLRKLEVNSLSPGFFKDELRLLVRNAFTNLTSIDIGLKVADTDLRAGEHPRECFRRLLANGVLKDSLDSAKKLTFISIAFESVLPFFIEMSSIFGATTWDQLEHMSLTGIASTQKEFMGMLKHQPKLEILSLTTVRLNEGSWPETLEEMRDELTLESFTPYGFLEDHQECWPMDLLYVPMYIDDFEEFDLTSAIDTFVTEQDDDEGPPNPLGEGFAEFEEADIVRDTYGVESDIDMMSISDQSEVSLTLTDSDVDMSDLPDLESIGVLNDM